MISRFSQNEACFTEMAASIMRTPGVPSIRWDPPVVPVLRAVDTSKAIADTAYAIGDTAFWYRCMQATGSSEIQVSRESFLKGALPGTLDHPQREDWLIWFNIFAGLLSGSQSKGIVFVADDDLRGAGDVVESLNKYSAGKDPSPILKPDHPVFRKIKAHWYIFYEYYN